MRKFIGFVAACALAAALAFAGCSSGAASTNASSSGADAGASSGAVSSESTSAETGEAGSALAEGAYSATFTTDSSMFHVNEANDGKGKLTVTADGMTIHVSLVSKKILNLYAGTADEAQADAANVLQPSTDTVTYSDGATEEVYGFDIPVPALDEEFDVAILGEKGVWYDHKVSVSDPVAE